MTAKLQKFLWSLVTMLLGLSATAVAQAGYLVDFNTPITTNSELTGDENRDFKVAPGWSHVVDSWEYNWSGALKYCPYNYLANGGVDNSGALEAGAQQGSDAYGDNAYINDLLITPPLSGAVSMQIKLTNASGYVEVWTAVADGNSFKKSLQVPTTASGELNTTSFVTVSTGELPAGTQLAIKLANAVIDNFTAGSADLSGRPGLEIVDVDPSGSIDLDADAEGNFTVSFTATVRNNGEVDLDPATAGEGYSLSLFNFTTSDTLVTVPITQALAVGETSEPIVLSATRNISESEDYENGCRYNVIENITHSQSANRNVTVYAYEPYPVLRMNGSTLENGASVYLGTERDSIPSKQFELINDGAAPLEISAITVPDGFTSTLTALTVEPHERIAFTIAMAADVQGARKGALVAQSNAGELTLNLCGAIVPEGVYFCNFNSDEAAEGIMAEQSTSYYSTYGWKIEENRNYGVGDKVAHGNAVSSTNAGPFKLILPKIAFAQGETLNFDLNRASSYNGAKLTVYYSPDRATWTRLRTLALDAEKASDKIAADKSVGVYTLTNIPEGEWYVAFEVEYESEVNLDNVYGGQLVAVSHDLAMSNVALDAAGQVNSQMKATMSVTNLKAAEAADSYTARLYFGDKVVKELAAVELPTGQAVSFNFSFTPHEAGTFAARMELAFADGFVLSSPVTDVTIGEEVYTAERAAGQIDNPTLDKNGVWNYLWNNTQSEFVYTADQLGIAPGTPIHKLSWHGYYDGYSAYNCHLTVRLGQTAKATLSTDDGRTNPDGLTQVFDGDLTFTSTGDASNLVNIIELNLATPYIYNGDNLLIQIDKTSDDYKGVYVELDPDNKAQAIARYKDAIEQLEGASYNAASLPIVYLGVEGEPKTLSGTVTNGKSGETLAGVEVKAVNGEVEYSATTNAEGAYQMSILKDSKEYDLTVNVEGFFPYSEKVNVRGGNAVKDIALQPAAGFLIKSANVPATATVNNYYTASVVAANYTANSFAANSYTAQLVIDGNVVAEAETPEVAKGSEATFAFRYMPHEACTAMVLVRLSQADNVSETPAVELTVNAESGGGLLQVGDSLLRDNNFPINFYYNHSVADIVYTPEMLADFGLKPGNIINKLTLRMTKETEKTFDYTLTAWVGAYNYDASNFVKGGNREQLIKVMDGEARVFSADGASGSNPVVEDLVIDFSNTPIIFDGTNAVRLCIQKDADAYVGGCYFALDNRYQTMWYARNDYSSGEELWALNAASGAGSVPVTLFDVVGVKTLTGTVTNSDGLPVEGATLKAQSGEVYYTAESDATGAYTLPINQPSLSYTLTVSAPGYADKVIDLPAIEDMTLDVVLEETLPDGISSINADEQTAPAYNVAGQRVAKSAKGVVIRDGKKSVVK